MPDLVDASGYGEDTARACLDLLNRLRAEQGVEPLPEPPAAKVLSTETLVAYVNHGRWIVRCPCGSAQLACRSDRRFWCVDCRNDWAQGKWVAVTWPTYEAGIETLLGRRSDKTNRNWVPAEDLAAIEADNALHGVGV